MRREHRSSRSRSLIAGFVPAALIAALSMGLGPAVQPAGATYPGPNGKIAFSATRGGVDQIWTMSASGTNKTEITSPPRQNTDPAWNFGSTRIVFSTIPPSGFSQIFAMNPNGSLRTQITTGTSMRWFDPVINTVGTKIVASGKKKPRDPLNLYMMDADGTHIHRFTNIKAEDVNADFSPDGIWVTFERDRANGSADIMIKKTDGTALAQLTHGGGDNITPSFSPDSARIGYSHIIGNKGTARLMSMNNNGTGKFQVTNNAKGTFFDNPQYSPDGTKFVFIREKDTHHPFDIYTCAIGGGSLDRYTDGNFIVTNVTWGSA